MNVYPSVLMLRLDDEFDTILWLIPIGVSKRRCQKILLKMGAPTMSIGHELGSSV